MKKYYLVILPLLGMFLNCKNTSVQEDVMVIVQPTVEKGSTNSFKILFKDLTLKDSIFISKTDSLEFNDNPSIREDVIINGHKYLEYYTYLIPLKNGEIALPVIKGITKNKTITATPRTLKVVDKIKEVTENDIVLNWVSDKNSYQLTDTIHFALYEYSRFYEVKKTTTKQDSIFSLPKMEGKGNKIIFEVESDMYKISGNKKLEHQLSNDFEVITFDYDFFRTQSVMEKLNNTLYIKTLLVNFLVLPKQEGSYTIEPSEFMYYVDFSMSDVLDSFTPNDDGSHTMIPTKNSILIKSNKLSFKVN